MPKSKKFYPKTTVREVKRQATEAVGSSFCKTLAEPITNSDTNAKLKHQLSASSGLLDLMFEVPKGNKLDTAGLRGQLNGIVPKRTILVELVAARTGRRPSGEIVVVDGGTGMSSTALQDALEETGGDKGGLSSGVARRGIFGRGLTDVMQAHESPVVETYDGSELSIATGNWEEKGWAIALDVHENPRKLCLKKARLFSDSTGTAVRFVLKRDRCAIPQTSVVARRLANFYMLRLIASDPNVNLLLRQQRAGGQVEDRVEYDFPVGDVLASFSKTFQSDLSGLNDELTVDFLVCRTEATELRGFGADRDARENGLLIVDDADAVYDLTFADPDYERAGFLSRIFGVVRVHGLREVCERCLNDPDSPTSPLRTDREGLNRDHPFSLALLEFIAKQVRPLYEKERDRLQKQESGDFSQQTKKRLEEALKQLNRYFHEVTELGGPGDGPEGDPVPEPKLDTLFLPDSTRLVVNRPRRALLLVRDSVAHEGSEVILECSDGLTVEPDVARLTDSSRWNHHPEFFQTQIQVTSEDLGGKGHVEAVIEGSDDEILQAKLTVTDVLDEPEMIPPDEMEFRPDRSSGQPNRMNRLTLLVNPQVVSPGHYVRFQMDHVRGDVKLREVDGSLTDGFDVKLDPQEHEVTGQNILRVVVPWRATSWDQSARVIATVKVAGAKPIVAVARIATEKPQEGGFFREIKYDELDEKTPSMFAAGVITINASDALNRQLFGSASDPESRRAKFDRRLRESANAQQRLSQLLVEEASFRALEHFRINNQLPLEGGREVTEVHERISEYKFDAEHSVYRALVHA